MLVRVICNVIYIIGDSRTASPPTGNDSGANGLESLPERLLVFPALPQWKHMLKDHKTPGFPPFPVLRSLLGFTKTTTKKETLNRQHVVQSICGIGCRLILLADRRVMP